MKYVLMHKNIQVAVVELHDDTGFITRIFELNNPEHLPVGVNVRKGIADRSALNEWWADRSIPASRSGVRDALEVLGISNTKMLLTRCYGLSLSDQYWIKPENINIEWKDINFFDNSFSDDIGDVLFDKCERNAEFDFSSPDNTSDGNLKKRWKIINGKRCLVKAGSKPFRQQPFNELIATRIMEKLGIPHVPYTVVWDNDEPYSVCEDFVTKDTELISAWRIMQIKKKESNVSVYQHYINCCEQLGVKNITESLNQMIVLDFLIANEDRHCNNFGLLRNAETLEWYGAAPIFDSGTSLGYDDLPNQIITQKNVKCKPFKSSHKEQLKLVTSFDWIDFSKLDGIKEEIREILSDERAKEFMEESRCNAIVSALGKRFEYLQSLVMEQTYVQKQDNIKFDVTEDIAEDYSMKME